MELGHPILREKVGALSHTGPTIFIFVMFGLGNLRGNKHLYAANSDARRARSAFIDSRYSIEPDPKLVFALPG